MEPQKPLKPPNELHRPTTAVVMSAISLMALVAILVYQIQTTRNLADQGAQVHVAVCANKAAIEDQLVQNRAFLLLTVPEREAKYGKALGDIPNSIIQRSINSQMLTLHAYRLLTC